MPGDGSCDERNPLLPLRQIGVAMGQGNNG